jgi:hypothetical protein
MPATLELDDTHEKRTRLRRFRAETVIGARRPKRHSTAKAIG